jgi:hypothetical protein
MPGSNKRSKKRPRQPRWIREDVPQDCPCRQLVSDQCLNLQTAIGRLFPWGKQYKLWFEQFRNLHHPRVVFTRRNDMPTHGLKRSARPISLLLTGRHA